MDNNNTPNSEEQNESVSGKDTASTGQSKVSESDKQKEEEVRKIDQDEQMRTAYHLQLNQSAGKDQLEQSTEEEQQQKSIHKQSKQKRKHSKPSGFLKMIAAAIIGSVLTLGAFTQIDYFSAEPTVPDNHQEKQSNDNTSAQPVSTSNSVADIVEQSSEAIVGIVNMSEQQQNPFQSQNGEMKKGVGSGVIYNVTKDAAYIVTNNHVIEGASTIEVSLENGETVEGSLVGADPLTDIAVVKIDGEYDVTPLKFGDSDELRTGEEVIAIGNPLGLELSRTVTQGIVSALDRTIPVKTSAGQWEFEVIQTDAAINPGNSGGALINIQGELVGINSLKIAANGAEGLGFAIPSNKVKQLIDDIVENGQVERPYVGVGLKSVSEIPAYYLQSLPEDVKDGAVVLSVDENSAAGKAGIKVEDVIVSINGENITSDNDFKSYLYKKLSIDDKITIGLYRQGEMKEVELTLTSNADTK